MKLARSFEYADEMYCVYAMRGETEEKLREIPLPWLNRIASKTATSVTRLYPLELIVS